MIMDTHRPKWLKLLITVLCIWDFFLVIPGMLWMIFRSNIDINSTDSERIAPPILIFILVVFLSGYISSKINDWQEKFLDRKPKSFSFIVIGILLLIMLLPTLKYLVFK